MKKAGDGANRRKGREKTCGRKLRMLRERMYTLLWCDDERYKKHDPQQVKEESS